MEFTFCEKYVLRFTEEEAKNVKYKVDRILKEEVSPLQDMTGEDLAFMRCRERQDRDAMSGDKWAMSVWCPDGKSSSFIKLYCNDLVIVRAVNSETDNYEKFEMDVVDAVSVLQDLQSFLCRSDDVLVGTKRCADSPAFGDECLRRVSPRLANDDSFIENGN
jgi:hypothetical protein